MLTSSSIQEPYTRLSEFYDQGWGKFALSYLPFLLKIIDDKHLQSPRVLDVCCGTGLLAKSLGERGIQVVGVDSSSKMIEQATRNCQNIPLTQFAVCKMTEIAFDSGFDLVVCSFDSINYLLKPDDLLKFFNRVALSLKPEGQFVFDSNTLFSYSSWTQETYTEIIREINGNRFRQLIKYNPFSSLAEIRFEFPDGVTETHFQKPWDAQQLREALSSTGLDVVWIKNSLEGEPLPDESNRIFLLTSKNLDKS